MTWLKYWLARPYIRIMRVRFYLWAGSWSWFEHNNLDCSCCGWNLYVGPFGLELDTKEIARMRRCKHEEWEPFNDDGMIVEWLQVCKGCGAVGYDDENIPETFAAAQQAIATGDLEIIGKDLQDSAESRAAVRAARTRALRA